MLGKKAQGSFARFPHEVLEIIFAQLSLTDLNRVARVCRRFSLIANTEFLWQRHFQLRFGGMEHPELLLDLSMRTTAFNNRFKEALRTRASSRLLRVTQVPGSNGFYPSVQAAVRVALPGDVIAVRPGTYDELLSVEKRLEIVGDGARDQVLLKSFTSPDEDPYAAHPVTIACIADGTRFANVSMAAFGRARILLRGKDIRLEGCDLKLTVAIAPGSQVTIRRSTVHHCEPAGVLVIGGGTRLLMEANIIHNNYVGVMAGRGPAIAQANESSCVNLLRNKARTRSRPQERDLTLACTQIQSNSRAGVQLAGSKTRALIVGNEICDNLRDGLHLSACTVVLRGNAIRYNVRDGVRSKRGARVEQHNNSVYANNIGDEPSMWSRLFSFSAADWLDPSKWGAVRAIVVVVLLLLSLIKIVWRVCIEPPIAHLVGSTHQR